MSQLVEVQRLEAKMTEDEVKAYVEEEVMSQLLVLLRAVPAGDIGKRGSVSDPLQQVLGFCAGVLRASDHNALLERITSNLKLVQGLVQTEDMEVLSSSVSELKQRCQAFAGQSEERERDDALAFFFFFCKHKVGATLKAFVEDKIQRGEKAVALDAVLNVLQEALAELKGKEALEADVVDCFRAIWTERERFQSVYLADASPSQVKTLEALTSETWTTVSEKLGSLIANTTAGCLEHLIEGWHGKGVVTRADGVNEPVDFPATVSCLRMSKILDHIVWKEAGGKVPLPLGSLLNRHRELADDLVGLAEFAYLSDASVQHVFQDKLPAEPSVDKLHSWCGSLEKSLQAHLEQEDFQSIWPKLATSFLSLAEQKVKKQTLQTFEIVGELVQKGTAGIDHVEANSKALEAAQKNLPSRLSFRPLLDLFFQAGRSVT